MKKKILWALGLLLLLPVVAFIAVVAINRFDESLDPKAAAWGEPRPASVPEAQNGYYALLGIGAPLDADPAAFAQAWLAEARAAAKENRTEKKLAGSRPKRTLPCDPLNLSCLDVARANAAELTGTLALYKQDLARYESLLAAKRYVEVLDYTQRITSALPSYPDVTNAQRAYLSQAALAAERGDLEAAVGAVERDIAFYRVMLGGARTVIGKMIAVRRYWTSLAFLADLMRQKSTALEPFAPRLKAMMAGIDTSTLRLGVALESNFAEWKYMLASSDFFNDAGSKPAFASGLFYLPNATINGVHSYYLALAEALQSPPNQISEAARKVYQAHIDRHTDWSFLYNPTGKDMLVVTIDLFDRYALRLHDLDAFNRMVGLRLEAMLAKTTAAQAAEFSAKSDARFHDPYTGKPMAWDAAKGRFHFTLHGFDKKQTGFAFSIDGGTAYVAY